ncbi:MAG: DUF1697 domain-containing protein [Sphingobium sp.]
MPIFVGLMRAINVGKRQMPMKDLRALAETLGYEAPETYVASGNLIFGAKGAADAVATALEKAIEDRFGFFADVILRDARHWKTYRDANPFAADAAAIPKMVHLCLARAPLKSGLVEGLRERAQDGERIELVGDGLWVDFGSSGVARSKLTPAIFDRLAGSTVTARNWNTVQKLQDMIEARA